MDSTAQTAAPAAIARPHSKTELFVACTVIALQGFGGVLAIVQREMVDKRRWLTRAQFVEEWAVAQILPGPNVVNLVIMLGDRYFGIRGSLAATAGILALPLCIVLGLVVLYNNFADLPVVQGALRGMGAAAAGLIGAAAIKMIQGLAGNVLGGAITTGLIGLTFALVALLRVPLIWAVLGLGVPACLIAWARLRRQLAPGAKP